jgi:maltooligosyltrehalose trehalohydrolase
MQTMPLEEPGAVLQPDGVRFRIWAPDSRNVEVVLDGSGEAVVLAPQGDGWFVGTAPGVSAGARYRLRLNGSDTYPDPWSRSQPDGVHGASEVVDLAGFRWTDGAWRGLPADDLVIMELHVGTATQQGTFDALIERLPYYVELGVTALEIMPVSEFSGSRNWGYDGVYLFAPTRAYGGPAALQRFVDAAHGHGLAVILDVVYNHFGPEGNYLPAVTGGRIFTEKHHTPWGAAVNYDDAGSAAVRATVLANVQQWMRDYHIDGLRLDATHAIMDESATHILEQIADTARAAARGRSVVLIAEDERNERKLLLPASGGGYGLDCVWADDTHHVLRRLTAGDTDGYYSAYEGSVEELSQALRQGWLYEGRHYAPTDEQRGTPSAGLRPSQFVHCIQNHDQVGNRAFGERLNHDIELDLYRAVSALLLLTPYTPMLWMGQEWAASSPFLYFTDHPDELGRLVTEGRREEFGKFARFSDPELRQRIPDPQGRDTFERSRLDWKELQRDPHRGVLALYRELLQLRRFHGAMRSSARDTWRVEAAGENTLLLERRGDHGAALQLVVNFRGDSSVPLQAGQWRLLLHSEDAPFGGAGEGAVALDGGTLRLHGAVAVLLESA